MVHPLWAEPRPKNMFLGGSQFQVTSSPRGFVESGRGFGIWLAQWHLHSPTELDFFSFSSQGQGHKVTNLENCELCFSGVADFNLHLLLGGLANLAGVSVFG